MRELVSYRCTHYPIGNAQRNAKDVERPMTAKLTRAIGAALAAAMAWTAAGAAECPRKDALGTSRVLAVDAATSPRVGLKSFPQTLPLGDHEVVLTFDDGPWPGTTPKVLAALAHECVLATFFMIGRSASAHPEMVRRIAALGHTIGHHSFGHPNLKYLKPDAAAAEIDKGIAAVEAALHGTATTTPTTPFFRFPYFESQPATLDLLQKRDIVVFGADLWASDWDPMAPKAQLKLLTERLQSARKGIILLHDPKAQTAAMLPAFLRYLRDNHYRVVHLVPRAPAATAASTQNPK
jgi:peptidoglycan/xylan/chitin deacetylase (PgdA/CDA1 family)